MKTYVVLFRGINVGGKNILPMKELALLFKKIGYQNVKTYINSGNVILSGKKKPSSEIAALIETKYGFKPKLFIIEKPDFELSVRQNPYSPTEGKFAHLYFCSEVPTPNFDKLNNFKSDSEEYKLMGNMFYLHAPDGIARSKLVVNIESCLGIQATGRNLNTINKLSRLLKAY